MAAFDATRPRPLISVVTPSFNQARFLRANIASVRAQNYAPYEQLVIDGGSTDGTVALLQSCGEPVRWISERDRGQTDALNKGVTRARGEIIGWLNSDDEYTPGAFDAVAAAFAANPRLKLVFGDVAVIDAHGAVTGGHAAHDLTIREAVRRSPLPQPGAFFHRSVFTEAGLPDESFHYAMDYEFWLRLALTYDADRFARLPRVTARFRVHGAQKTAEGTARFDADEQRLFAKHLRAAWRRPDRRHLAFVRDFVLYQTQLRTTRGRLRRFAPRTAGLLRAGLERLGYTDWVIEDARRGGADGQEHRP